MGFDFLPGADSDLYRNLVPATLAERYLGRCGIAKNELQEAKSTWSISFLVEDEHALRVEKKFRRDCLKRVWIVSITENNFIPIPLHFIGAALWADLLIVLPSQKAPRLKSFQKQLQHLAERISSYFPVSDPLL
jgi:hypothetical protein